MTKLNDVPQEWEWQETQEDVISIFDKVIPHILLQFDTIIENDFKNDKLLLGLYEINQNGDEIPFNDFIAKLEEMNKSSSLFDISHIISQLKNMCTDNHKCFINFTFVYWDPNCTIYIRDKNTESIRVVFSEKTTIQ